MYLKQFIKNTNLILISHGFGMQTQFIESLLDGHSKIIQFPTNYKDYFLNLRSQKFSDAIEEFINLNPGYVYDIFNVHNNEYFIIDRSRVTPMIEDRDYFYFDKKSLSRIKKNDKLKKYYNFIKKNLFKRFKKKFLFEEKFFKSFKKSNDFNLLYKEARPVYLINKNRFKKIYEKELNKINFVFNFNKKNLLLFLHYCLAIYFKKNPLRIKYILFNLHDYKNINELLLDFNDSTHLVVGQDFKRRFSRNKFKVQTHHESVVQFCYKNITDIDYLLRSFEIKKTKNYLFFNEYISQNKNKFIYKILKVLKLKNEEICFRPTFMSLKSYGNSRNKKILYGFSSDFAYTDWWNYLKDDEIYYLDYFYRNFFKYFKNKPSKLFLEKKNISKNIFTLLKLFFMDDYKHFCKNEMSTKSQVDNSKVFKFNIYDRHIRLPLKLTLYTIIYPIIFFYKVYKIEEINKKYKNKKIQFRVFL